MENAGEIVGFPPWGDCGVVELGALPLVPMPIQAAMAGRKKFLSEQFTLKGQFPLPASGSVIIDPAHHGRDISTKCRHQTADAFYGVLPARLQTLQAFCEVTSVLA